jgi:hypothetical protein
VREEWLKGFQKPLREAMLARRWKGNGDEKMCDMVVIIYMLRPQEKKRGEQIDGCVSSVTYFFVLQKLW